jgi:hypothetical protein
VQVSIIGRNFGPSGSSFRVEPADKLTCNTQGINATRSQDAHSLVQCTSKPGRGAAEKVRVTVEGQQSAETSQVNISYVPPEITQVTPNPGNANSPSKITIDGYNFGDTPVFVRVWIGSSTTSAEVCGDAQWMPSNPPKYAACCSDCMMCGVQCN